MAETALDSISEEQQNTSTPDESFSAWDDLGLSSRPPEDTAGRSADQLIGHEAAHADKDLSEKIVRLPSAMIARRDRFLSLQKWQGVVMDLNSDHLTAQLTDLDRDSTKEEAEIPLSEVPRADMDLVMPGAVFYWNIGYRDQADGQRTRVSMIRFRRLPVWTETELEEARREANELSQLFDSSE